MIGGRFYSLRKILVKVLTQAYIDPLQFAKHIENINLIKCMNHWMKKGFSLSNKKGERKVLEAPMA